LANTMLEGSSGNILWESLNIMGTPGSGPHHFTFSGR
jgi:hypothetical protein